MGRDGQPCRLEIDDALLPDIEGGIDAAVMYLLAISLDRQTDKKPELEKLGLFVGSHLSTLRHCPG